MNHTLNPARKEKEIPVPPRRLPIRVEFVLKDLEQMKEGSLTSLREFCNQKGVVVESRVYDSYRSKYDRDEIVSLPALHIFVNGIRQNTFYPQHRPYQIISDTVREFEARVARKREKKDRWRQTLKLWWDRLKTLAKRKTRMDREQEFKEQQRKKSYDMEQKGFDERIRKLSAMRIEAWS